MNPEQIVYINDFMQDCSNSSALALSIDSQWAIDISHQK